VGFSERAGFDSASDKTDRAAAIESSGPHTTFHTFLSCEVTNQLAETVALFKSRSPPPSAPPLPLPLLLHPLALL
jgi:hypothetical protein